MRASQTNSAAAVILFVQSCLPFFKTAYSNLTDRYEHDYEIVTELLISFKEPDGWASQFTARINSNSLDVSNREKSTSK